MEIQKEVEEILFNLIDNNDIRTLQSNLIEGRGSINDITLLKCMEKSVIENKWEIFELFSSSWIYQIFSVTRIRREFFQVQGDYSTAYEYDKSVDELWLVLKNFYDKLLDNSELNQADEELIILKESILPKLEMIIKISNHSTNQKLIGSENGEEQNCLVVNSLRLLLRCTNCDNNMEKINELTNKLSVQKNPEIYELLLNSNLKAKFAVIKKMLENRRKNDINDSSLIESLSRFKAPLYSVATMLKLMTFNVEEKEKIGEIFLRNRAEELFQYGVKKNIFPFTIRAALTSLTWSNRILNNFIDDHFSIYRELFNNNKLFIMKDYDIPNPNAILKAFNHRRFQDCQQIKSFFFKNLFQDQNLSNGLVDSIRHGNEWFTALFAVTIGYDMGLRLSQGVIDFAFTQLLNGSSLRSKHHTAWNSIDYTSQEVFWCCRLLVTIIWCGYTLSDTNNLKNLYEKTKSNCSGSDTFDRLLHFIANSSQKQFSFLMRIANRNHEIMTLKSMARSTIRSELTKPFRRNLAILLDKYPHVQSDFINLENEIVDLKLERIKFRILNNKFRLIHPKL
ncbi:DgyrCDS5894 [Dimorphilus gyrociliatus]|uniref:DgyrCDS5894 n=1 Tax=Dimorphilus gyrociliatus TaxID=2664684 RepID=A0A7I8VR54_9ANNE|nr:DgyrCDS5894 [Dimorphilus gyrociliatus]